jgi:aspartyl-tRNA(Asn)/glutamyl-tRNA(Gln) amidotransferase subunit B
MRKLHELVRYLEICDGNMQEGSFRCDANVSVRPKGQEKFGTRAEIKNINSFKFVEKAINHEIERQIDLIEGGGQVVQETRLYDAVKDQTRSMRSKEEANDYRYFPDPDLLPVVIEDSLKAEIAATMPELPAAKKQRFIEQYGQDDESATTLTSSRELADFYEAMVAASGGEAKLCTNWMTGDVLGALNKAGLEITDCPVSAERLAGLILRIADNTISGKIAKQVFDKLWNSDDTADAIIEREGLVQITDTGAIEAIIDTIIAANQKQVAQYLGGNEKVFGFFVGQVMKETQGKANPAEVNKLLTTKLKGE